MAETDSQYELIGDQLVESLRLHAGLSSDSRVLDIGCGYGRLAHSLIRGGFAGRYLGIDILEPHIAWCSRALAGPRIEFRHFDLQNDRYNPEGTRRTADLELDGELFDVVALFSVFTHLWPEDVVAYLRLCASALAPEGRTLATFFLLDDEWRRLEASGDPAFRLPHEYDTSTRYESEQSPLHRVGYELDWVLAAAADAGLRAAEAPVFGRWSGRTSTWRDSTDSGSGKTDYQDAVVFSVAESASPGG